MQGSWQWGSFRGGNANSLELDFCETPVTIDDWRTDVLPYAVSKELRTRGGKCGYCLRKGRTPHQTCLPHLETKAEPNNVSSSWANLLA